MSRYTNGGVSYAPLYIHSFPLIQTHRLVEAEKFNIHYTDPAQINNIPDKLRWYRYRHGLIQRDVASYVGMDRSTYSAYEEVARDYYPIAIMEKVAELYDIPVTEFLDEYNLFLYCGQGKQIKAMRQARNMTQVQYAKYLGVCRPTYVQWEHERVRITKQTWRLLVEKG